MTRIKDKVVNDPKQACDAVRHRPVCQESCFTFLFRALTFLFILTY